MSSSAKAHLVYGFDLGSAEFGWQFKEAVATDSYGSVEIVLPWFTLGVEDSDEWVDNNNREDEFPSLANARLLKAFGFDEAVSRNLPDYYDLKQAALADLGVRVDSYNHIDFPRYALIATASESRADTGDVTQVAFPSAVVLHNWDRRLDLALKHLGLTPKERHPGWLLYPYYS